MVAVAAHQTQRWVQGRISPQVAVAVAAAEVVVEILTYRAGVAEVAVAVGEAVVEVRLHLQQ